MVPEIDYLKIDGVIMPNRYDDYATDHLHSENHWRGQLIGSDPGSRLPDEAVGFIPDKSSQNRPEEMRFERSYRNNRQDSLGSTHRETHEN
jgi:hypothetical protein